MPNQPSTQSSRGWPDWRVAGFYMLGGFILGNAGAGFWLVVIVCAFVWAGLLISMCRRPPAIAEDEIVRWKQQSWDDAQEIMRLREALEHAGEYLSIIDTRKGQTAIAGIVRDGVEMVGRDLYPAPPPPEDF